MSPRRRNAVVVAFSVLLLAAAGCTAALFLLSPGVAGSTPPASEEEGGIGSWFLSTLSLLPGGRDTRNLVAVMVENHEGARPFHAGLDHALQILEFPVEGQISRFAVVLDADDLPARVGPVRSIRPYFVEALLPEVSAILYAGGSPEALELVADDRITAVNGLAHPKEFLRDDGIHAPHNLFLSGASLASLMPDMPPPVLWPPYTLAGVPSGSGARVIRLNFYNPSHNVRYDYDRFAGTYTRLNGDVTSAAHPRNVLVLEMPIQGIGEYGRLTIDVTDRGRALLFRAGKLQKGTWSKRSDDAPFVFETEDGEAFRFAGGLTWVTVLPSIERVRWE